MENRNEMIRMNERNIKHARDNLKYEAQLLAMKKKGIRPLTPEYEYEVSEEYLKLRKHLLDIEFKRKKEEVLHAIAIATKENARLKTPQRKEIIPYAG